MLHGKIGLDVFLAKDIDLYFHDFYYGFSSSLNTIKYINYLKNDRREYDAEIGREGITVTCRKCGASKFIPTDSLISADAFLNSDSLTLE